MQKRINQNSVILAISFSQFVIPFMFSGVGIAIPSLAHDFQATGAQLGLIESIYLGAAAAVLLPMGKIADQTDKKTIFKIGLFCYMLFSSLLAVTSSIEIFISLRLLQGVAGGMILATNMAILADLVPRENLGKAIGLAIGAVYLGLTTGPLLAGLITTHLGWRYVFIAGGILNAIAVLVSFINIPSDHKFKFVKIDMLGTILIIVSISLLVGGGASMSKGGMSYLLLIPGILTMFFFILSQKRGKDTLINLDIITSSRQLKVALIVQLINYSGTFGITFLFSLYLQTIKLMTPQQAGMVLIISPVIMAILAPIFGRISDKISPALIATVGMSFCFMATLIALTVDAHTSMSTIYIQFASMGLGFAMFSSPNMNIIMSSVEKRFLSMASAIVAELRSIGMVLSLTIISTFLSIFLGHEELTFQMAAKYLQAMHFSIICFVVLMGCGVFISVTSLKKR